MTTNQVNYFIGLWNHTENIRHNKENERIAALQTEEAVRHNVAVEAESKRHNLETELLSGYQAKASLASAAAAQTSAAASYKQAQTREKEYELSSVVQMREQNRKDMLAAYEADQIDSVISLNNAKSYGEYVLAEKNAAQAGLYSTQTETEKARKELVQQQARTESANYYNTWAQTIDIGIDDVRDYVSLYKTLTGLGGFKP